MATKIRRDTAHAAGTPLICVIDPARRAVMVVAVMVVADLFDGLPSPDQGR
jgi:hypothetical protein